MPNHRIYKNIAQSQKFKATSTSARVLYLLLFSVADDYGSYPANPEDIKINIFPEDKKNSVSLIRECLLELDKIGLIRIYEAEDKFGYKGVFLSITRFSDFQVFGSGYNKRQSYPKPDEMVVFETRMLKDVKDVKKCTPYSPSYSNSNTKTVYIDREKLYTYRGNPFSSYEIEILEIFIDLGFKLKENIKDITAMSKWLEELCTQFDDINIKEELLKWRDYFSDKHPKNHKSSFRNWLSNAKKYATDNLKR